MSASEFREWQAYYELEPFGPERDNWHAAVIATILANAHRKANSRPYHMTDFFYTDAQTRRRQQDAQVLAWFEKHATDA